MLGAYLGHGFFFARFLLQRLLGVIYLLAFLGAARQFVPLRGSRGLDPIRPLPARLAWRRPSLFHLHYSDAFAAALAWAGAALALAVALGATDPGPLWLTPLLWLLLWALYLSFVNVGGTFFAFGWEILLLEAGFLAVFLGPARVAVSPLAMLLFRWLLFRAEFGAGLIKLRGDRCWRDLTCLEFHHQTQPLPNPMSWHAHHLPRWAHRAETAGNHVVQLLVPWLLFAPQPLASVAGALVLVTQAWLMVSGNYAWLNALTLTLAVSAFGDGTLQRVLGVHAPAVGAGPPALQAVTATAALAVALLSVRVVLNLLSPRQRMNASFDPLHLVNTYGAFGSVTRERYEVILEGQRGEGTAWREYAFKAKPGDVTRRPPQVAPYHLRLDWLMWFVPLSGASAHPWLPALVGRLLRGDRGVLRLMGPDPFPDAPPERIRARLYRYRFTTPRERAESGAWWHREPAGTLLPAMTLGSRGELTPAPDAVPRRVVWCASLGARRERCRRGGDGAHGQRGGDPRHAAAGGVGHPRRRAGDPELTPARTEGAPWNCVRSAAPASRCRR
ncbi:MAG TPA: lipase maturation factor family protein, partial [Trueperaceae bacterium]|nr:lipase maturation factor family protein [Trueperaceae bacterium]